MIAPLGWIHLLLFGVLIPISAIRAQKIIRRGFLPDRRRYFKNVLAQLVLFATLSLFVAWRNRIVIFPRAVPPPKAMIAGAIFLAVAIAFGWKRWQKAVIERKKVIALFMPASSVERSLWMLSSALAGFGEEITWRGVQTVLLTRLTGNLLVAIVIAIVMFAIAHAIQGWKSVGIIAVFSAGFHFLVWLSGSLYVGMVVHFLYDLVAGLSYAHLGRKFGYFNAIAEEQTAATDPEHSATRTT